MAHDARRYLALIKDCALWGMERWEMVGVVDVGDRRKIGQKLVVLTVVASIEMFSVSILLHRNNLGGKMSKLAILYIIFQN